MTAASIRRFPFRAWLCVALIAAALAPGGPAVGQTVETLHPFSGNQAGGWDLVRGTDGSFYGVTNGMNGGKGSVIVLTPVGPPPFTWSFTTLHDFTGFPEGIGPYWLVQGTDGDLYGTTTGGGTEPGAHGTIFKITTSGTLTTLYSFTAGAYPIHAPLTEGSDGNFYGPAAVGGANGRGMIYRITPSGTLTVIHDFAVAEGLNPYGRLVEGGGGVLYGTTGRGGTSNRGTVYKLTPPVFPATSWTLTTLGTYHGPEQLSPGHLTWGDDGKLYGTLTGGDMISYGAVFVADPSGGDPVRLHVFTPTDGIYPYGGLLKIWDGSFLGTTGGSIFRIATDGSFTKLHTFGGSEGSVAYAGLVSGNDGSYYGMTNQLGTNGFGAVYRMIMVSGTVSGSGTTCAGASANIQADLTGTPFWSLTWSDGVTQSGLTTSPVVRSVSPASTTTYTLTAFSDAHGPGTILGGATVTVTSPPAAPLITAPATATPGETSLFANVESPNGTSTYTWGITNGTITFPSAPPYIGTEVLFTAGASGTTVLSVVETSAAGCTSSAASASVTITPPDLIFRSGFEP